MWCLFIVLEEALAEKGLFADVSFCSSNDLCMCPWYSCDLPIIHALFLAMFSLVRIILSLFFMGVCACWLLFLNYVVHVLSFFLSGLSSGSLYSPWVITAFRTAKVKWIVCRYLILPSFNRGWARRMLSYMRHYQLYPHSFHVHLHLPCFFVHVAYNVYFVCVRLYAQMSPLSFTRRRSTEKGMFTKGPSVNIGYYSGSVKHYSAFRNFFPKLCLILKEWFLTRFPPNFQERFLMFSASPEFVFWGPKIKQFCVKQVWVDRENVHKNLNSGLKLKITTRKENWGKKMASGVFPGNLRKIEQETNVL